MSRFLTERTASQTVDLCIMQGIRPGSLEFKVDLAFGENSTALAGLQKAAQKFLILFLTEQGTVSVDAEAGTTFLSDLSAGLLRTDSDVAMYFKLAAQDVLDYMARQNTESTPADEILVSAELTKIQFEYPKLVIQVQLLSQAGASASVVLPLSSVEGP